MGSRLSQPVIQKKFEQGENSQIKYCSVEVQGWEKQMQNSSLCKINIDPNNKNGNSLFAIFDGYRGFEVSAFVKETFVSVLVNSEHYVQGNYEQALKEVFSKIDQLIRSQKGQKRLKQIRTQLKGQVMIANEVISQNTGCTAGVVLITKKKIYSANIGDVQMHLLRDKKILALSQTHRPDSMDEKARINMADGQVIRGKLNGNVDVSRGLGLYAFKQKQGLAWDQQMITCSPHIKVTQRNIADSMIFVGCDGIWENLKNSQTELLVQIVNSPQFQANDLKQSLSSMCDKLLSPNPNHENNLGFKNMSGILIKFNQI